MKAENLDKESAWYCVRTKTKREYIAAQLLNQLDGIEAFCPRLRYRKATRRGKVWWVEAMFPTYIFAHFSREESERKVAHSHGVLGLLKFGSHHPKISINFINELKSTLSANASTEEDTLTLQPTINEGDEIEIAHGTLQGFKGSVVEILPSTERVKILVEFLGDQQTIETDLFSLLLPNKPLPDQ